MSFVCTGKGASDTHAIILNNGTRNTHPSAGTPYGTISAAAIVDLIKRPPSVAKEAADWIIPSNYNAFDARSHEAQRNGGSFHWQAADIDSGNPSLDDVDAAIERAFGPAQARAIYSSRSATEANRKWRVLIPLAQPLAGQDYGPFQAALFDALESCGLTLDRTLERAGQLVYLPNRGEFYEFRIAGQSALDPHSHPIAQRAAAYKQVHEAAAQHSAKAETSRSPIAAFRRKHSIAELLALYGYERKGSTDHWRSPYSQSGSYSTQDRGDHWISLSHNDAAAGLGKATPNGSRYGDAFDLYLHFNCQGNAAAAEAYAKQCLLAEDDSRYGEASAEHGASIWQGLISIGNKPGPAGAAIALEESARKAATFFTNDPKVDKAHEWDIPWPPGIVGEVAKHLHRSSSRPVKQFAIAQALYLIAGLAGSRYNVEGFSLNLYLMIAANSGAGKGESRRSVKRLFRKIGHAAQDLPGVSGVFDYDMPPSAAGLRKMFEGSGQARAFYKEDADAMIESMTNTQPGSLGDNLRSVFSSMWDAGGEGLVMGAIRYSKKEDSVDAVESPSLTAGLDLQIAPFKRYLGSGAAMTTGIAARFIYITRYGERMNNLRKHHEEPPEVVLEYLTTMWQNGRISQNTVTHIQWEASAKADFYQMDDEVTELINEKGESAEILNRAHMQAAKVAGILALGENPAHPVISPAAFAWAKKFVMTGYLDCLRLMDSGEVGAGERVRVAKARKAAADYYNLPPTRRSTVYRVPRALEDLKDVIPEIYFLRRLSQQADFKGSDVGATTEDIIRRTLDELVKQEILIEISRAEVMKQKSVMIHANVRQKLYVYGGNI